MVSGQLRSTFGTRRDRSVSSPFIPVFTTAPTRPFLFLMWRENLRIKIWPFGTKNWDPIAQIYPSLSLRIKLMKIQNRHKFSLILQRKMTWKWIIRPVSKRPLILRFWYLMPFFMLNSYFSLSSCWWNKCGPCFSRRDQSWLWISKRWLKSRFQRPYYTRAWPVGFRLKI